MAFYNWSKTAALNSNADPTVNMAEGMPPSAVNDGIRALMAAAAQYRDDITGSIVTTGTSTAYVVASNSGFDTLAHLNGQIIAFSPHTTNAAGSPSVTLNVDTLGAKPIRSAPGVEIPSGTLIQGTPYLATYNSTDGAFYLHGFYGNPYSVPIASSIEFWGTTAPNSSFVFPWGQAISRTTYSTLFAMLGTTYGTGDGSTTFNLPDLRGRTTACPDNMGGGDAQRLSGANCSLASVRFSVGGAGGEGAHTLLLSEVPAGITSSGNNNIVVASQAGLTGIPVTTTAANVAGGSAAFGSGGPYSANSTSSSWAGVNQLSGNNTVNVTSTNTSGNPHNLMQPTILCNRVMRII